MTIQRGRHAFERDFDPEGIIRLGSEKRSGGFGSELSYFRLTDAPKLVEAYGGKPEKIHVMLPSNEPDEVFEDKYELWRGSKKANVKGVLLCHGDGITCHRMTDEDDPFRREAMPCPTPEGCAYAAEHTGKKVLADGGSACGAVGRLRVIVYRVNIMEVYEIRTGSWNAFQGLRNKLISLLEHPMFGRLVGIPMAIERFPKPNRFGKTNYPVRLTIPTWTEMRAEAERLRKMISAVQEVTFQLPDPGYQKPPPALQGPPADLVHEDQGVTEEPPAPADAPAPKDTPAPKEVVEVDAETICDLCGREWPPENFQPSAHPNACPDCGRQPDDEATPAVTPRPKRTTAKGEAKRAGEAAASVLAERREKREAKKAEETAERKDRAAQDKPKNLFKF